MTKQACARQYRTRPHPDLMANGKRDGNPLPGRSPRASLRDRLVNIPPAGATQSAVPSTTTHLSYPGGWTPIPQTIGDLDRDNRSTPPTENWRQGFTQEMRLIPA